MLVAKSKYIFFFVLVLTFAFFNVVQADVFFGDKNVESAQSKNKKEKTSSSKKKPAPQKMLTDDTAEADNVDEDNIEPNSKAAEGPPFPFIFQNLDKDKLDCKATPFIEPEQKNLSPIKKGNNLNRKPGSPSKAQGNYIQISGLVTDENCLPVQGAVIEIWQTDTQGKYEWEYAKKSYWEVPLPGKDNNFLFSGSAQTDNLGQFNFLTIFPGYTRDNAPYINVIVKRTGYDELHTRIYFAEHPRNESDQVILALQENAKAGLMAVSMNVGQNNIYANRAYYFPIVMRGINAYKRF